MSAQEQPGRVPWEPASPMQHVIRRTPLRRSSAAAAAGLFDEEFRAQYREHFKSCRPEIARKPPNARRAAFFYCGWMSRGYRCRFKMVRVPVEISHPD